MFNREFSISGSSLKLLKLGERGVVSRLNNVNDRITQKLSAMGIFPGVSISLEQRFPRFIIKVGCDRFALSQDLIQAIYIRILDS
ncbi:ferrous iron transport protein A [Thermocoleostomius sinensis]|uniref:Ferrous iron transport protein A n=1 Tax=Thermocoleostomius sinensis A174 TaxID=2016057 RepID=A0A9E8Z8U3_9CYAN|nr:ferrous iron transport protein A [Thermocoleostomius sinensis]WAL58432.1 ferrous iron transport protein A [Thermocoleostomius sinensis A174]